MSCHGSEITTVEGIGNKKDGYHPVQVRFILFNWGISAGVGL